MGMYSFDAGKIWTYICSNAARHCTNNSVFTASMTIFVSYHPLGVVQFDDRVTYSTNSLANHSLGKEMVTNNIKCNHLYEIAYEINNTRRAFHRRGDIDCLKA